MAKTRFSASRVNGFKVDPGKSQSFLWDSVAPGLGLRATAHGAKAFIFQAKLRDKSIRVTIGAPASWSVDQAQAEARRLKVLIDNGHDPREVRASKAAAQQAAQDEARRRSVTLGEAWAEYIAARKAKWSVGHYHDHEALAAPGNLRKKRGKGLTTAGPLHSLMSLPLTALNADTIAHWLQVESAKRPTAAALAFRLLRAFATWAADTPRYRGIVPTTIFTARSVRDNLPKSNTREGDCLQREQLADWFRAVREIRNPILSCYLQGLLITGARRRELSGLRWVDVNFEWRSMVIRDKTKGQRTIPLPPYLLSLLKTLPRHAEWVFSSATAKEGKITEPRYAHRAALARANLPPLSLHGLRRSFSTLSEWLEMPAGISAQILGHAASSVSERHYRRRPLDMLRTWHDRYEQWLLGEAGIEGDKAMFETSAFRTND